MTTDNNNGHSSSSTWSDMPYPAPAPAPEPEAARPAEGHRPMPTPRAPATADGPGSDARMSSYAPAEQPMSAIPYAEQPSRTPVNEPPPLRIPSPGSIDASETPSVRIGLWGSSRAGKSTYLAALPIAGLQTSSADGRWIVSGVGDDAQEYLVGGVDNIARRKTFPPPTQIQETLTWAFHGPPPSERRLRWRERDDGPKFALQLQDVPGEFYRTGALSSDIVDHFANSQGLVYLFDPVSDVEDKLKSFDFFYAMLQAVLSRVRDSGGLVRNRLPHEVAVCVTKFDDPTFFDAAVRGGWVIQQNAGSQLPMVPEKQAEAFFDWVCRGYRGGTAAMINDAIKGFFHPDRVRYYATSAIGFRLNSNEIFDYRDFRNTETVNNSLRLRTTARPINVLEPLIDLERRIRGRRR